MGDERRADPGRGVPSSGGVFSCSRVPCSEAGSSCSTWPCSDIVSSASSIKVASAAARMFIW